MATSEKNRKQQIKMRPTTLAIQQSFRRHWNTAVTLSAVCLALAFSPTHVLALGSRIPNQDAAAIARGNAFVATADNPAAIYYNPAGITQLDGQNLQLGSLFYLNIYADYESSSGTHVDNIEEIIPVPQLHYVFSPTNTQFSFGVGVYAPFGLGMKWPSDAPFRDSGIEAQIQFVTINPVVAWEPVKGLSMAIGPTFNYSTANLRQGVGVIAQDEFDFEGGDWAYGFSAGLLWQPHPQWSFGARYFSATEMNYEGEGTFSPSPPLPTAFDTTTQLNFPQIATFGVSFRPTTNWNIEVNFDYTDWDVVNTADIEGLPPVPLYWQSSWLYEFGLTRNLGKGYYVSVGYFFSQASTPEAYFTPLVPDTDLHTGSLGIGYKGEHWSWAIAGQIIGGPYRDIEGQVENPQVDGSWRLFTPTLSASIGYHF